MSKHEKNAKSRAKTPIVEKPCRKCVGTGTLNVVGGIVACHFCGGSGYNTQHANS